MRHSGGDPLRLWAAAVWLAVWQAGSMALGQPLLLPSPAAVGRCLLGLLPTAAFWSAAGGSALRIMGGFLLSCIAGILSAALAARSRRFGELLTPVLAAVRAVPVMSFIILAFLWLPDKTYLALLIAFLMAFPVVCGNVLAGLRQVDRGLLEMARSFRVPFLRQVSGIYIPQTLPYFRAAASLGVGLSWKAGVAAEVVGVVSRSMGERLYEAKIYYEAPELFAWTAVIVALSAGFERLFLLALDRLAKEVGA